MDTKKIDFDSVKDAASDMEDKAKTAFEKGKDAASDVQDKAKTVVAKGTDAASDVEDKARTVVAKGTDAASDVQDKAKTAFEKGKDAVVDAREFTKGNVEALVESGKILAAGLKDFGSDYIAGAKSALTTLKADAHQLKSVKSPTDFFKLQGEFVRSAFHSAKEKASKRREAVVELAQDAFAPISDRISLVRDKFKKAA